jgi:hypothetical protein
MENEIKVTINNIRNVGINAKVVEVKDGDSKSSHLSSLNTTASLPRWNTS